MAFLRQKIVTFVLLGIVGFLLWKCWLLKGSVVWTGFITSQAENLRETVRAGASLEATVHDLNFYLIYYGAHIKSVREPMLIQVIERDKRQTLGQALAYLRSTTGEDLGDDPEKWIAKYYGK